MLEKNIDVCQTCLSNKAPKLPLREEILTQGFETVLLKSPERVNTRSKSYSDTRHSNSKQKVIRNDNDRQQSQSNDEEWAKKMKRRQKRWKSAVTYEKYVNPDDKSLASKTINCSFPTASTSALSDSVSFDSLLGLEIQNKNDCTSKISEPQLDDSMNSNSFDVINEQSNDERSKGKNKIVEEVKSNIKNKELSHDTKRKWNKSNNSRYERKKDDAVKAATPEEKSNVADESAGSKAHDDLNADCTTALLYMIDDACFGILSGSSNTNFKVDNVKELAAKEPFDKDQIDQRRMYVAELEDAKHVVAICGKGFNSPSELYMALEQDSVMAKVVDRNGKLPLHSVCSKGMPMTKIPKFLFQPSTTRHKKANNSMLSPYEDKNLGYHNNEISQHALETELSNQDSFQNSLLNIKEDAYCLKDIILIVLNAYPEGALMVDRNGDLPVHLLARQLWDWEKHFKDNYLSKDTQEETLDIFITRKQHKHLKSLFKEVSFIHRECVQCLLQPLHETRSVCRAKGSKGTLLPIHIAALYGVKFDIVHGMISAYDKGVSLRCEGALNGLRSILPLELLDRHKPKRKHIELAKADNTKGKESKKNSIDAFHQASDLLFMHYPNVEPYRNDINRLNRVETLVRKHAQDENFESLPMETRNFWLWMNTFELSGSKCRNNDEHGVSHYAETVKNVITGLDSRAFSKLRNLQLPEGEVVDVFTVATPTCLQVLQEYHDYLICEEMKAEHKKKSVLKRGKYTNDSKLQKDVKMPLKEKIDSLIAQLCRFIFGIINNEDCIPTNFIILPYKLKQSEDGGLELASKEDADVALKFAESLLGVNNTDVLSHTLNKQIHGEVDTFQRDESWYEMEELVEQNTNELLSTYENGKGYLYLLDEHLGVPVVSYSNSHVENRKYPFEVTNPTDVVERILPLMQMGIALMRGERGLSVLADILLQKSVGSISEKLRKQLQDVVDQIHALPIGHAEDEVANETKMGETCDELLRFAMLLYSNSSEKEQLWANEIMLLKDLYKEFDHSGNFAGLRPIKSQSGTNLWTQLHPKCKGLDGDGNSDDESALVPNKIVDITSTPKANENEDKASRTHDSEEDRLFVTCLDDQNDFSNDGDSHNFAVPTEAKTEPLHVENMQHSQKEKGRSFPEELEEWKTHYSKGIGSIEGDVSTLTSNFDQFTYSDIVKKDFVESFPSSHEVRGNQIPTENLFSESIDETVDKVETFRNTHTFSVCSERHHFEDGGSFVVEEEEIPNSTLDTSTRKLDTRQDLANHGDFFSEKLTKAETAVLSLQDQDKVEHFRNTHTFSVCSDIVETQFSSEEFSETNKIHSPIFDQYKISEGALQDSSFSCEISEKNTAGKTAKKSSCTIPLDESEDRVEDFREAHTFSVCDEEVQSQFSNASISFEDNNNTTSATGEIVNHLYKSISPENSLDRLNDQSFEEEKRQSSNQADDKSRSTIKPQKKPLSTNSSLPVTEIPKAVDVSRRDEASVFSAVSGTTDLNSRISEESILWKSEIPKKNEFLDLEPVKSPKKEVNDLMQSRNASNPFNTLPSVQERPTLEGDEGSSTYEPFSISVNDESLAYTKTESDLLTGSSGDSDSLFSDKKNTYDAGCAIIEDGNSNNDSHKESISNDWSDEDQDSIRGKRVNIQRKSQFCDSEFVTINSNIPEGSMHKKLSKKDIQLKELQDILTAFDEEERILLEEKQKLIAYLEAELNKVNKADQSIVSNFTNEVSTNLTQSAISSITNEIGTNSAQSTVSSITKEAYANQAQSVVSSVTNEVIHSKATSDGNHNDSVKSVYSKNSSTKSHMSRVRVLEEMLLAKDEEINKLQMKIKDRVANLHGKQDLKIAELLSCLSEKEDELRYYEHALEQCVTEY